MRVKSNMGAPGIDKVSVTDFEANLSENLSLLINILNQNAYQPLPLLTFEVDKSENRKRTLSIPAIRDRVIQTAFLLILQPLFDKDFLDCSYGYRPSMSAHGAIKRIEKGIRNGKRWVVDTDIEAFFDSVDKEILIKLFSEKVSDVQVVEIIKRCIETQNEKGIPQGSSLSPLLSNIYLHTLDSQMISDTWIYTRFADDFVILCNSSAEAGQALGKAREILQNQILLRVKESKTRICQVKEGFVFLGYRFTDGGKYPASKAFDNLKQKVYKEISDSKGKSKEDMQDKIKSIIRGWQNYFKLEAQDRIELMKQLDAMISSQTDSVPSYILKAALCIEGGDNDGALDAISHGIEIPTDDPEIHYQWGSLYDTLGLSPQARDEYYSALRFNPTHKESAYSIGLSHLKDGDIEKSLRFLQKAVQLDPDFAEAHLALGKALESWGLSGAAKKAFKQARELDPELQIQVPILEDKEPAKPFQYTKDDMQLFMSLFSGREGVFATQWVNSAGKNGYTPVYNPLSEDHVETHLSGKETLGLYMLRSDNTVRFGVIDIDITKAILQEVGGDQDKLDEWNHIVA